MRGDRLRSLLHTVFWVLGAVLVGGALHRSVVTGEVALTTPVVLVQLVVGLGLVVAGYALRPEPGWGTAGAAGGRGDEGEEGYDPELSPLGAAEAPRRDEDAE